MPRITYTLFGFRLLQLQVISWPLFSSSCLLFTWTFPSLYVRKTRTRKPCRPFLIISFSIRALMTVDVKEWRHDLQSWYWTFWLKYFICQLHEGVEGRYSIEKYLNEGRKVGTNHERWKSQLMGGKVPIENFTSMTEELDSGRRVNRQEKIAAEKKSELEPAIN